MTFEKQNPLPGSPSLECEQKGLELLREHVDASLISIPKTIKYTKDFLVLEKIESAPPKTELWQSLGVGLARLHKKKFERFGLGYDNYIGLNQQWNHEVPDWGVFFVEKRLLVQAHLIRETSLREEIVHMLKNMLPHIAEFLNAHSPHPSLVHGDLWSGNVMFSKDHVWLIDPAVYFGDREVDLAMTKLFGRFSPEFYLAYEKEFPLAEGKETREKIYNLYHYLNHYNLFGSSYWNGVESGLNALKEF
ncbi:MAG: fructosamine kinase family protein [Bdellovibrionales bacterium]